MDSAADLLKAVAALAWPVFAFTALFIFKDEIKDLIIRLKKGRVLGQEIELTERLDKLQVAALETEAVEIIPAETVSDRSNENPANRDLETTILMEAARSPRVALMLLAAELEQTTRRIFAQTGWARNRKNLPFTHAIEELSLPEAALSSLRIFWQVRNQIVHARGTVSDEEILRAIDSGLVLLRSLKAIPVEAHVIRNPGV